MDADNEPEILFKWTNLCRLCLSTDCDIDLFSKDPSSQEVLRKIRSCLNLLMYLGDPMPRKLCARCLIKVDDWCQFREICLKTESDIKKRLENYKKIDFVQDYFDRSARFLSSEVVSSSRIPATLDDYNSSVISVNTEDDNRSCSTNSNQTCGSSGHCEPARIRISKDLYPSNNTFNHINPRPSLPTTKDCGTQCRREPENQFRKISGEVGTIASITGSALGLWDNEGEVEEINDSILDEVIHHEIIIKQEICTTTCPDCGIDFPSDEDYAFHTCSAIEASMQCDETDYYGNYTTEILNQRKVHITPWKCEACCEYYQTRRDLNEHYSGTCRGGLIDCQFCGRKFVSESELYQHETIHMRINIHLTEDDLYCCRKCPLRFCNEKLFNEHFKRMHMKNENNYKCDICEKEYVKKYLYDLHVAKHNESKTKKKIEREKQNELAKGQVRCARCGQLFLNEEELEKHKSEKHKNPTPFRCRICNNRFSARSQLLLHVRTHRGKRKRVAVAAKPVKVEENELLKSCTMCNAKFLQETDLQSHMLMHSKPVEEPVQPKLEKPEEVKEIKEQKNLLARYKCSLCAKVFVRSNSVPKHIRLHHKGQHGVIQKLHRPVWVNRFSNLPLPFKKSKFQCTLCPKFFYSKDKLSKHFQEGHSVKQEILDEPLESNPVENDLGESVGAQEPTPEAPMQRKPNANETICKICNNIYSKKYLSYHMRRQHVEKPVVLTPIKEPSPKPVVIKSEPKPPEPKIVKRTFKCCHCLRTLFSEWSLRRHENACLKHLKKKCNVCGIKIRTGHTEKHMAKCKSIRCRKCNKIFFKYIAYLTHGCSQVRGDKSHKCHECLNDYPSEEMLNIHVRKFHRGEDEALAQELPNSLPQEPNLEPEIEIKQENDSTVQNGLCNEESNKIVCKIDDKFYCTYCDVFFNTVDECTNHESEHPRGNFYAVQINDNSFQCTVCDVMFEARSNCLVHINYHKKDFRGDTVMDCQEKEGNLNSSNESQEEPKSFQCALCPSAFTTERSYNIHNFYVHSNEMKAEVQ